VKNLPQTQDQVQVFANAAKQLSYAFSYLTLTDRSDSTKIC